MPDRWRALEVMFAGVIAIFTIVLAGVSYYQYEAAIEAANAAKESADIAQSSLTQLQRASVFVANVDSNWHPDWDKGRKGKFWWHFRPIFENVGATQTKDLMTNIVYLVTDRELPKDFIFPPNAQSFPAFIPPHDAIVGGEQIVKQEQMIEIQKGKKFFYIYGTVTYRDVFDGTPVHTTKFCRQIMGLLGDFTRPDKNKTEMFFGLVFPEQNTAD